MYRSGVQVVEVDARVFDEDGHFVTDLTIDDFELLEDGVPQQLQTVYLVGGATQPGAAAAVSEVGPTVNAEPARDAAPAPRHTWIFFFDLNHLMPDAAFGRARDAVHAFIRDGFAEGDVGGVVAGSRMVNDRLTTRRDELAAAVASVKPLFDARSRRFAETQAKIRTAGEFDGSFAQEADETRHAFEMKRLSMEKERAVMDTFSSIDALASGLAKLEGPKTIVFLSEGFGFSRMEGTLRNVVGQAARAGARVYTIDVRGLNRDRGAADLDGVPIYIWDETNLRPPRSDSNANVLNSLAVDTGGLAIRSENNIGRALAAIAGDANRFWVLGYQPANANFDGTFRSIDVKVTRPGVRVRARRGYLALHPASMLAPQPIT